MIPVQPCRTPIPAGRNSLWLEILLGTHQPCPRVVHILRALLYQQQVTSGIRAKWGVLMNSLNSDFLGEKASMGYTSFLGLPKVPPLVLQTTEVYCLSVPRLEVLNQGVNRTGCLGGLGGCPTPLSYIWSSPPFLGLSMVLSLYFHNCEVQIPPIYEDTI